MDPFGPVAGDAIGRQVEFAFFIGAGAGFVAVSCARNIPALAQSGIDHGAPDGVVSDRAHGGIRIFQDGQDACRIRHSFMPIARSTSGQMSGEPFDERALFHDLWNARLFASVPCPFVTSA